ncbi:hypothetical protein T492DRAFT_1141208 [Pavlovales sp. CCMP2436]|nr:hypothetical protein T492DRAFT_1141208 [Pavlovales sp. CCMP2436]
MTNPILIQGTAAVTVAGLLGALRLRATAETVIDETGEVDEAELLQSKLRTQRFLFHGSGAANLGAARLLVEEGGVPLENIWLTNSKGLHWTALASGGVQMEYDPPTVANGYSGAWRRTTRQPAIRATTNSDRSQQCLVPHRYDEQRSLAAVLDSPQGALFKHHLVFY